MKNNDRQRSGWGTIGQGGIATGHRGKGRKSRVADDSRSSEGEGWKHIHKGPVSKPRRFPGGKTGFRPAKWWRGDQSDEDYETATNPDEAKGTDADMSDGSEGANHKTKNKGDTTPKDNGINVWRRAKLLKRLPPKSVTRQCSTHRDHSTDH